MAEMSVELVAIERRLWSGQARSVSAETTEGEIGILPGHEPVLGQLVEGGTVTIEEADGQHVVAAVNGGFFSVTPASVRILAEVAEFAADIDADAAREVLADPNATQRALTQARGRVKAVELAAGHHGSI